MNIELIFWIFAGLYFVLVHAARIAGVLSTALNSAAYNYLTRRADTTTVIIFTAIAARILIDAL